MKNIAKLVGIIALLSVMGFGITGCSDDSTDDNGGPTPNANEVSGKTYFVGDEKIVFSTTAEGASSGTYTVGRTVYDDDTGEYELENDKFKYTDIETGTYTWNETAKTVTLKPERVAYFGDSGLGPLEDRAAYQQSYQAEIDYYRTEIGQDFINTYLLINGFSTEAEFINYSVNEAFSNKINAYSFSADGKALFLERALPANIGVNPFAGQTYYGLSWDDPDTDENTPSPDGNKEYVFAASGNTFTYTEKDDEGEPGYSYTGSYAYDSGRKFVFFRQSTINGEDREAFYNNVPTFDGHNYEDDDAYRAAQTNDMFYYFIEQPYNSTNKTIGF